MQNSPRSRLRSQISLCSQWCGVRGGDFKRHGIADGSALPRNPASRHAAPSVRSRQEDLEGCSMNWGRRFVHHWLFGDRVRIPADEGRWLRLEVGQRVIINDMLLVVACREVIQRSGKSGVRYGFNEGVPALPASSPSTPPWLLDDIGLIKSRSCKFLYWAECCCESD